jgi:hypothetical protein
VSKDEILLTNDKVSKETVRRVNIPTNDNIDEWIEILRHSGLTPEELDRLAKNKNYTRVIEAIEMLSRLLVDKNMQIRLLERENNKLNDKNESLFKLNSTLTEQNLEYKKRLDKYNQMYQKIDEDIEVILLI